LSSQHYLLLRIIASYSFFFFSHLLILQLLACRQYPPEQSLISSYISNRETGKCLL
jgi:hypothetical protein